MKLAKNQESDIDEVSPSDYIEVKPRRSLSQSVLGVLVGIVLGVIVTAAASYVVYDSQVLKKQEKQLAEITQQRAVLVAEEVLAYFSDVEQKLAFFASQSLFRDAVVANNLAALEQTKESIARQINDTISVRTFKLNEVELNSNIYPPIRFSELALIQAAESGAPARLEAAKIDDKWLLHLVAPVSAGLQADPEGVLWVTSDTQAITQLLYGENTPQAEINLRQKFSDRERPIVTRVGSSDLEQSATAKVGDTHWEIEVNASSALLELTHVDVAFVYLLMLVIGVVSIACFGGLGFFIGRKINQASSYKKMEAQMRGASSTRESDDFTDPLYQPSSLMEVDVNEADESLLGMDDGEPGPETEETLSLDDDVFDLDEQAGEAKADFPQEVFRAYDIRGIAHEQIDKDFALNLGKAIGSELLEQRENTLAVARDARTHSPELTEWLIRGVLSTGCNVLNIGTVPTPLLYFTIETMEEISSGVMVTASHNSAEYNGFKVVLNKISRSGEDIQALRIRMNANDFMQGQGNEHHHDIVPSYIDTIFSDVALAGEMSVVIDAGNGVAGKVAPKLFDELGCRVTPLYCDLDGHFPNHNPDPSVEENLHDLIEKVKEVDADLGVALDGDGDRLAVVSRSGKIYWADRLLMLFATDIISRSPGADVIFDVKSTRHLNACVATNGGRPIMWKTGHSLMKQKMLETGAVVGAEYSGHIFIKDRWFGFDDGMYAAARLLEVLSLQGEDIDTAFEEYPESIATPEIRVPVGDDKKFDIIEKLKEQGDFGEGRLTLLDGVRADFSYGWGLVRASNTSPDLTMRFEADDEESIHTLKALFVKELRAIDSTIEVNWDQ